MPNADWIVCHDSTHGELACALECRRCGTIQRVVVPMEVDVYVALGKAFERIHRHCRPRAAEGGADRD